MLRSGAQQYPSLETLMLQNGVEASKKQEAVRGIKQCVH